MAASNSERFLAAFNVIEDCMEGMYKTDRYVGFATLIHRLAPKSAVIREYGEDLQMYAKLRNAIVHEKFEPGYVIAEPHLKEVEKIEKIALALSEQKTLKQLFNKGVTTFQQDEPFSEVLSVIHKQHFSQFPIYKGSEFVGLLTVRGISNWLAEAALDGNAISVENTKVSDVLRYEENAYNFGFIRASLTLYDAAEQFKRQIDKGSQYYALLITENGKKNERLLGIVTPIDVVLD